MAQPAFTNEDRGTAVFDHDGNQVGTVSDVRDGSAHVDTSDGDSGILDDLTDALGWDDDDDTHELRNDDVDTVDNDGVHLRQF
ncbi:hypothetical protein [Halococcus hamelinensis]|uniref:hypothetical protein n=1 Tax=Halococcus hamelinensis TaxID=332168 RepID=UPI000496652E|nr:hypothetical protein [Halococcus hamelinensis]